MIVNTDGDSNNFTPLFRIQGAQKVIIEGSWSIDGNRDNQTYPATNAFPGRGSIPYRHNGEIEICPSSDNITPSRNIDVKFGGTKNAYLNGLVLWQVENAHVSTSNFENTTWNGIAGAGLREVTLSAGNYFYRCGSSTVFDTTKQNGDRAGIQFREFHADMTSASEGIPCIVTGEYADGGINEGSRL